MAEADKANLDWLLAALLIITVIFIVVLNPGHLFSNKPSENCCDVFCKAHNMKCWSRSHEYFNCMTPESNADNGYAEIRSFYIYDTNKACQWAENRTGEEDDQ